jgi:hypothetical protein
MDKARSTHGKKRNAYMSLVGVPEGNRPRERPRHRWEGNITMDLRVIVWFGMDWSHLAQERDKWRALVTMVMDLRVSYNVGKFLSR